MSTFPISGYQLTLKKVRDRVRSFIKEDEDIDSLIDQRINDALQMICWFILPRSLLVPPKTYQWVASQVSLPARVMRVASIVVLDENRRPVVETDIQDLLQVKRGGWGVTLPGRWPYYFAYTGRNLDPSFSTWFDNSIQARQILFDSVPPSGSGFEVSLYIEHPELVSDNQVIFLDPPYHGLVIDGALLEMAEFTGESVADFEKRQRRFERRLALAKRRMNDDYAKSVVMGESAEDVVGPTEYTIPRPTGPRYP